MLHRGIESLTSKIIRNRTTIGGILAVVILLNMLVVWHVSTEKTVYYWDLAGYWTYAIGLANTFQNSFRAGFELLIASFSSDYNYLPVLPIAFIMQLFGTSRIVYVLSILNLYVVPFAIISAYLVKTYLFKVKNSMYLPATTAVILFLPAMLIPVFGNMPDVAGLLVVSLIILLFARMDIFSNFTTRSILLGVLLCLLIVLRRWYAFWVLGAIVALAIVACYMLWTWNGKKIINKDFWLSLKWPIVNMLVVGMTAISLLALLFPFTLESFKVNYGDVYSAYRSGGHKEHIIQTVQYFGGLALLTSFAGYLVVFMRRKYSKMRPIFIFFAISSAVTFYAFSKTQDFGAHHYYLMVPAITLGLLAVVAEGFTKHMYSRFVLMFMTVWLTLATVYAFIVPVTDNTTAWKITLGAQKTPLIRDDVPVLKGIVSYIERKDPDALIYVASSSVLFNDSVLRNVNLPESYVDNIINSAHIDKRDGFPNAFFAADYVVVPNRLQTHTVNGQGQLVVTSLIESIISGKADNLREVKEFTLKRDLKVKVYKKTGPYSKSYVAGLRSVFMEKYPEDDKLINIKDTPTEVEIPRMMEGEE